MRNSLWNKQYPVMENDNMHGHWTGIFSSKGGVTTIDFTEDVTAKRYSMWKCWMPHQLAAGLLALR